MSSQQQPIAGVSFQSSAIFRLVTPTITMDASGGAVQVNANAKFNTNVPLDRFMLITAIKYYLTWTKHSAGIGAVTNVGSWTIGAQITEALGRTIAAFTDPVYVDSWLINEPTPLGLTSGAWGATFYPSTLDRILYNPWATAAQQLNVVGIVAPNNVGANGPNITIGPVIEYQLLPLTTDLRNYLATRVQIAGQA